MSDGLEPTGPFLSSESPLAIGEHPPRMYETYSWDALKRTKSLEGILAQMDEDSRDKTGSVLKKCLSRWDVVAYGVGSTVGMFSMSASCNVRIM